MTGLRAELEAFMDSWRSSGDWSAVLPRILATSCEGSGLLAARERLGRAVGSLKSEANGGAGALIVLDDGDGG